MAQMVEFAGARISILPFTAVVALYTFFYNHATVEILRGFSSIICFQIGLIRIQHNLCDIIVQPSILSPVS